MKRKKYKVEFDLANLGSYLGVLSIAAAIATVAMTQTNMKIFMPISCIICSIILFAASVTLLLKKSSKRIKWIIIIAAALSVIISMFIAIKTVIKNYEIQEETIDNAVESASTNSMPTPTIEENSELAVETMPPLSSYISDRYSIEFYSTSDVISLGDYYYQIEMYDKAIECYLSEKVILDSSSRAYVQSKLGKIFFTKALDDKSFKSLSDEYFNVALRFFNQAIDEGDYSALATKLTLITYYKYPSIDYDEIISTIDLAYRNNDEIISDWINAGMQDIGYSNILCDYIEQFCNIIDRASQEKIIDWLVKPNGSAYMETYTEPHAEYSGPFKTIKFIGKYNYSNLYRYEVTLYVLPSCYYRYLDPDHVTVY